MKVWPHRGHSRIEVGVPEIDRSPQNCFAEVERVGCPPANVVPGIAPRLDRVLPFRVFFCADAYRYRLGVDHERRFVNGPHGPVHASYWDGAMRLTACRAEPSTTIPNAAVGRWRIRGSRSRGPGYAEDRGRCRSIDRAREVET